MPAGASDLLTFLELLVLMQDKNNIYDAGGVKLYYGLVLFYLVVVCNVFYMFLLNVYIIIVVWFIFSYHDIVIC